jgi:hypothetical protein
VKSPSIYNPDYKLPSVFSAVSNSLNALYNFNHSENSPLPSVLPPNPNDKYIDEYRNFFQFIHMFLLHLFSLYNILIGVCNIEVRIE